MPTGALADLEPPKGIVGRGDAARGAKKHVGKRTGKRRKQGDATTLCRRKKLETIQPGLAEAMRAESLKKTPHAMLSRAVAGIRGRTLIINLPGSPKGATENLQTVLPVLPHAVQLLKDDPSSEASH